MEPPLNVPPCANDLAACTPSGSADSGRGADRKRGLRHLIVLRSSILFPFFRMEIFAFILFILEEGTGILGKAASKHRPRQSFMSGESAPDGTPHQKYLCSAQEKNMQSEPFLNKE